MNGEEKLCLTVIQEWVIDFLFHKVSNKFPFIREYVVYVCDQYVGIIFKVDYGMYGYDSIRLGDRELVWDMMWVYGVIVGDPKKPLRIFYECYIVSKNSVYL